MKSGLLPNALRNCLAVFLAAQAGVTMIHKVKE
jgi:hypothetical protein